MSHAPVDSTITRRDFMAGLAAVWMAGAVACNRDGSAPPADSATKSPMVDSPAPPQALAHFSAPQGAEVEAFASRIIPSDDGPGAKEAGVLYFIDGALVGFAKDQAKLFDDGLIALSKAVAKAHKGETRLSALTADQQDAILRDMEQTPFFGAMRFATIAGFLSLPKYGGNRDYVGWKYIGQDHTAEYKPPFGWYDEPANQMALLGRVL